MFGPTRQLRVEETTDFTFADTIEYFYYRVRVRYQPEIKVVLYCVVEREQNIISFSGVKMTIFVKGNYRHGCV
jgi:hypothetical protein